jgi:hydroxypyruvate isomerase
MKVSSSLTMLFTDSPFLERIARARQAGFDLVEFMWPHGVEVSDIAREIQRHDLTAVQMNFDGGDIPAGDRGILSDPDRSDRFRANVPVALELAEQIGCRQLTALVGLALPGMDPARQRDLALQNVSFAAEQAATHDMRVLVENVNRVDNGPYLLGTLPEAAAFIDELGAPNVRLQADLFHMQRAGGNIVATVREHLGLIGHIQIADAPARHEPGTGELNYRFITDELAEMGYAGAVGLEYRPSTARTEDSLGWLDELPSLQRGGAHV